MAVEEEKPEVVTTPTAASKPNGGENSARKQVLNVGPRDRIVSVASNLASQPLHNSDPGVWGVLTAISNNARKRQQVPPFSPSNQNPIIFFSTIISYKLPNLSESQFYVIIILKLVTDLRKHSYRFSICF